MHNETKIVGYVCSSSGFVTYVHLQIWVLVFYLWFGFLYSIYGLDSCILFMVWVLVFYLWFGFLCSIYGLGSCVLFMVWVLVFYLWVFGSSLPPVVCRSALVLFTLCSLRLYLHLFVGRLLSYLRYFRFVFSSSCW